MRALAGLVAAVLLLPTVASGLEIGPGTDFCAALRDLPPGEDLALQGGDYKGGCAIRRGGRPGAPLVIRAADPDTPPRLTRPDAEANMLEIWASDVIIRGLSFGPTKPDADGIRIIRGNRITIEDCQFFQMGGIAVVANHTSVRNLTVRHNVIADSTATGMYFGCHDGTTCTVTGLVVEGNFIRNVTAPDPAIGYGIEVKLNSAGLVRDNIIDDTKGPGIMVYGSRESGATSVVERNFVRGSRTSSGIVVGGGPAVVRNNVSGWNLEAGIALENYGRRGLLRRIAVDHNTVYDNGEAGIAVPPSGPLDAELRSNAVHARGGTLAFPPARSGLRLRGNLDCTRLPCFADAAGLDFSPYAGSPLQGVPSAPRPDDAPLQDDFFGRARSIPAAAIGAIERPGKPIQLRIRH
jgi:hypothetical protein